MSTTDRNHPTRPRRPAMDRVRLFTKHVLDPAMLLPAGRRHWYASALEHAGRKPGRTCTTPAASASTVTCG